MAARVLIVHRGTEGELDARLLARSLARLIGAGATRVSMASAGNAHAAPPLDSEPVQEMQDCAVLIVFIGRGWLAVNRARGSRHIDDPQDTLHQQISYALAQGIALIPVLVDDAALPAVGELPEALRGLAQLAPLRIREMWWANDRRKVFESAAQHLGYVFVARKPGGVMHDASPLPDVPASVASPAAASSSEDVWPDTGSAAEDKALGESPAAGAAAEASTHDVEVLEEQLRRAYGIDKQPEAHTHIEDALEPVLLGAAAPQTVRQGGEFTARFVAYVASEENAVAEELGRLSPRGTAHLALEKCQWQFGTAVTVCVSAGSLAVVPSTRTFVWQGTRNRVEFDVTVPVGTLPGPVVLKFDAFIDGIEVARLRLDVEIVTRQAVIETPSALAQNQGKATRTAFASYSSQDRPRVLDRVATARISAGLDIFLDCMSLHPGEAWKPRLEAEIGAREVFLLFWSQAARKSPWVQWEMERALRRPGMEAIQVHPLETGVAPPEGLSHRHFDDPFMIARDAFAPAGE